MTRCEGIPINMIRDQGLKQAQPLLDSAWAEDAMAQLIARWPEPPQRVTHGRQTQPVAGSLPGFAAATTAPSDPLAVIGNKIAERDAARKKRRAAIREQMKDSN